MGGFHIGVLAIFGIGIFGGTLGAWVFQKLRIPQVVGYIVIGLIIGQSGLQLVKPHDIQVMQPFNMFALGVIGFLVGGELKISIFRKYAKQFTAILLGEGLGAFVLVGVASTVLLYGVTKNWTAAMAAGVVFAAIASATDPASTIDVLWEYRAQGVLTTTLIAIVALDDALAMTLYGLGTSTAQLLTSGAADIKGEMVKVAIDLLGALVLGALIACLLAWLLRWIREAEKGLALSIGLILLAIWIAICKDMDVILTAMALGFTLVNIAPRLTGRLFEVMRSFSTPIYVLFFVLVGARLGVSTMPSWLWAIVVAYVICRTAGKMTGSYLAARATGGDPAVRRYMGLGLFAQGGVAVGLSIMASQHLGDLHIAKGVTIGDAVIFGVTATTLIVQILGPPFVKLAIKLAGEIGRNITEEDVIESFRVADVMDKDVVTVAQQEPVSRVIEIIAGHDDVVYPVVDKDGAVVGMVSLESLKEILADQDSWAWLVAADVAEPLRDKASEDEPLKDTLARMEKLGIEQMPVVKQDDGGKPVGMLDRRRVKRRVGEELLRRRNPDAAAPESDAAAEPAPAS